MNILLLCWQLHWNKSTLKTNSDSNAWYLELITPLPISIVWLKCFVFFCSTREAGLGILYKTEHFSLAVFALFVAGFVITFDWNAESFLCWFNFIHPSQWKNLWKTVRISPVILVFFTRICLWESIYLKVNLLKQWSLLWGFHVQYKHCCINL